MSCVWKGSRLDMFYIKIRSTVEKNVCLRSKLLYNSTKVWTRIHRQSMVQSLAYPFRSPTMICFTNSTPSIRCIPFYTHTSTTGVWVFTLWFVIGEYSTATNSRHINTIGFGMDFVFDFISLLVSLHNGSKCIEPNRFCRKFNSSS